MGYMGKGSKVEIFVLAAPDDARVLPLQTNAKTNEWPLHFVQAIPTLMPVASIVLVFSPNDLPNSQHPLFTHSFLVTATHAPSGLVAFSRCLPLGAHILDEAWSHVLQQEVHRLLPADTSSSIASLAFLSTGLAQCLSNDITLLRETIQHCFAVAPETNTETAVWNPQLSLNELIVKTAQLAMQYENVTQEAFRNALRTQSANLPFRTRSELRMACDACFSKFWEAPDAA